MLGSPHQADNFRSCFFGHMPWNLSSCANHKIDARQLRAVQSKCFARQAFGKVARYRQRHESLVDGYSQPGFGVSIGPGVDLKVVARRRTLEREHRCKCMTSVEPTRPAKRVASGRVGQTPRRARPLARRERRTARPARVFMRTRKPCVRLRRVVDGWKVRFMMSGLSLCEKPAITTVNEWVCQSVSELRPLGNPVQTVDNFGQRR